MGSLMVQIPTKWKRGLRKTIWGTKSKVYNPTISTPPWTMRGLDLFVCQSLDILLLAVLLVSKFNVLPWICWGWGTLSTINSRIQTKTDCLSFFCLKEQLLLCVSRALPRVPKNWRFFGGRGAGFDGSSKSLKIRDTKTSTLRVDIFPSDLISANAYLVVEYDLHLYCSRHVWNPF